MKIRLGIILIVFLALIGYSGAIAAQHDGEEHINRRSHGPLSSNIGITGKNEQYKSRVAVRVFSSKLN